MKNTESSKVYFDLTIEASSSKTNIWIGDEDGHFVQKETGVLRTGLLAGRYTVEFELGGTTYPIELNKDQEYTESQIKSGPTCPRPEVKLYEDDSND